MTTNLSGHGPAHQAESSTPLLLLTVEDAARQLSIGRTRMFALIKDGAIASVRIGRSRRVPEDAVRAYVQRLIATPLSA
ncbi:helix-turn-helix domain-containing protein [Actinokineospora globicatena]|uniref:Helix-turn-helix domain-containing protein n=1 Tax=Actinokineospora globicatena TaxID=103729 RepID=A0A9W6QNH9_9PSEU|nr:helix-turn-helix domain-containing protein [Actinokineospora globicatena]GLW91885.1 hypothetical protein Aglo03_27010 [Actinokineospora globicatena]